MGLARKQGPLAPATISRFLVPHPIPERLLFAAPLHCRMPVKFAGARVAESVAGPAGFRASGADTTRPCLGTLGTLANVRCGSHLGNRTGGEGA